MRATGRSRCSSATRPGSFATGFNPFQSPVTLLVGQGVSDVEAVEGASGRGIDLVVTDELTGQVSILGGGAGGVVAVPVPMPAGTGLSAIDPASTPEVTSADATTGVAGGRITPGGPTDLVTVNPGAETIGVLDGLGDGRFANPVAIVTPTPDEIVRMGDFTGDGLDDLAVLGRRRGEHLPGRRPWGLPASDHLRGAGGIRRADASST